MSYMKVVVIIPAFNEEKAIGKVLNSIPNDLVEEVVVVDNNSTDQTGAEVKRAVLPFFMKNERAMAMPV